jgi:hypothetical protein
MKKLLATTSVLMSAALALPALAQDSATYDASSANTDMSAAATTSQDGLNDPDMLGDPEDDGADASVSADADASGTADDTAADADASAATEVGGFGDEQTADETATDGTTDDTVTTTDDGATVPTELPATGGGGMAR